MTAQFGNILLFAIAFPLAPLVGLVNNNFELHTDANKILQLDVAPHLQTRTCHGSLGGAMAVLCFMATLTNLTLVCYYATDDCSRAQSGSNGARSLRRLLSLNACTTYARLTIVDNHAVAAASEGLEEGGGAPASGVHLSVIGDEEAERLIDRAQSYGTFE
ncbi:hypothetical protein M427DRAFT_29586 [Gonapodya prolifera JEL478]|uniref:Anoctamin transmembrane domain-containing protein n=1 Tax=Gonapodya prolifera (strain JEL478) TaxID=1344416 RepID=A0A139APL7_GONPJ|nr:hypothetical protein M427DRAFT_29586 [Gonapodya prolifera JEL478]|eukprot:KXS18690.1 hypothetical protein M427DRAFT_29586 [Gonapodya prolifera JEL478]